jgi:hypothetical protein
MQGAEGRSGGAFDISLWQRYLNAVLLAVV